MWKSPKLNIGRSSSSAGPLHMISYPPSFLTPVLALSTSFFPCYNLVFDERNSIIPPKPQWSSPVSGANGESIVCLLPCLLIMFLIINCEYQGLAAENMTLLVETVCIQISVSYLLILFFFSFFLFPFYIVRRATWSGLINLTKAKMLRVTKAVLVAALGMFLSFFLLLLFSYSLEKMKKTDIKWNRRHNHH